MAMNKAITSAVAVLATLSFTTLPAGAKHKHQKSAQTEKSPGQMTPSSGGATNKEGSGNAGQK